MNVIRVHETGGPEALRWEAADVPPPAPGEVRVRHTAIGLNFIDTYHRSGLYPAPLPFIPGTEAAGVVTAASEAAGVAVGTRVAYARGPLGAYAEERNIAASLLVDLPDVIDDHAAAAVLLKGMTAHYLIEIGRLVPGSVVLVHAAAGGVGLLLSRWAKHVGATVIGTAGGAEKVALAKDNGCDHVIDARTENVAERVRAITGGGGCDVVYDAVGKDTFQTSLSCTKRRGLFVSYGNASGPVPAFEPRLLMTAGSLFFTRPSLNDYAQEREEMVMRARGVFDLVARGVLPVRVAQTFPLREAAEAHRALESRRTTGSSLLLP
jgi:NADPH:quinone reductase